MSDCIFCKINQNQISASKIAENEFVYVIKDINPKAPIHYLIIPKKHIENLSHFEDFDSQVASAIILMSRDLSKKLKEPQDFKLIFNNGYSAGQRVFHSHAHFLAGKQMEE